MFIGLAGMVLLACSAAPEDAELLVLRQEVAAVDSKGSTIGRPGEPRSAASSGASTVFHATAGECQERLRQQQPWPQRPARPLVRVVAERRRDHVRLPCGPTVAIWTRC